MAAAMRSETSRERAEQVVDRYLAVIMSSDKDAGWQCGSLLGRLVEFRGELPESSGFSGFSKVWEQTLLLRGLGPKYQAAVRLALQLSEIHREAVAIDRAYRGRVKVAHDPFVPDRRVEIKWTDQLIAKRLDIPCGTLRSRIHNGYQHLIELMEIKAAA